MSNSIDSAELANQLSGSRQALERIAMLTDSKLDSIPTEGSFTPRAALRPRGCAPQELRASIGLV